MTHGVYRDDFEARVAEDGRLLTPNVAGVRSVVGPGLADAVQNWVNGAPNFGWAIFNNTGAGLDFDSSEVTNAANRPQLVVTYVPPSGAGTLEFEDPVFTVGEAGTTATIAVARVGGTAGAVSVQYATGGGTATAGTDYTAATGTLNFAAGATRQTFTVTIANDTAVEVLETINLTLSNPTGGATLGGQPTATLRLKDNDVDAALRLNELLIDPPDRDDPFEYVELIGTADGALGNVYFVAFEADAGVNAGLSDVVVDLSSVVKGNSGLAVIKSGLGGHPVPSSATIVPAPQLDTVGGILENNSTSFLLIHSPASVIAPGIDFDWNGDGTLDLPAGATVLDAVGSTDVATGDFIYGGVNLTIGTDNTFGGATRLRGNTTANAAAAWYFGDITGGANSTLTYNPAAASTNLPAGAVLTPGNLNFQPGAAVAPRVASTQINGGATQRSKVTTLSVTFDTVVTFASTAGAAFTLTRVGGGAVTFTATAATVGTGTVVTLNAFTGAETNAGSLNDGRYTLTALASQITAGGQQLDGNGDGTAGDNFTLAPTALHRLYGDATGDARVDNADFFQFRTTFGVGTGNTAYLAFLDYDGNGLVDNVDFFQFRIRFGTSI
jgi:hypothetical protein